MGTLLSLPGVEDRQLAVPRARISWIRRWLSAWERAGTRCHMAMEM